MVVLFEQDIKTNERQSSKGNQLKWENNNMWYKADYTGYEGLAEYIISNLLIKTTLEEDEYVLYDLEQIKYNDRIFNGVKSRDFTEGEWQIVTLERLFNIKYGKSLYRMIYSISEISERLIFLVEQVERLTGLSEFGKYINKLFTIDAFFLNEDRHTHNIAVLMNNQGDFKYCPIFDNAAGLLSDTTMDYPLGGDIYNLIKKVKSKTICSDFDEQLDVSESLYGNNIKMSFTHKNVRKLLDQAENYSDSEKERAENVVYEQMRKYKYLF